MTTRSFESQLEEIVVRRAARIARQKEAEKAMRDMLIRAGETQKRYLEIQQESNQLYDEIEADNQDIRDLMKSRASVTREEMHMLPASPSISSFQATLQMNNISRKWGDSDSSRSASLEDVSDGFKGSGPGL